ncbi:hypothetical protein PsYK624_138960 [Phanerochaete sordida]|uniref:Uncharacterized protein n=1 Tax=Phanerochaete sordida TaxID=48140 RepID=A0A9P3LJT1_9APHY|nr:hypothetical protein PsYK624_138960 [Phanerochaete sordida]
MLNIANHFARDDLNTFIVVGLFMNGAALRQIGKWMGFGSPPAAVQGHILGSKGVWFLRPTAHPMRRRPSAHLDPTIAAQDLPPGVHSGNPQDLVPRTPHLRPDHALALDGACAPLAPQHRQPRAQPRPDTHPEHAHETLAPRRNRGTHAVARRGRAAAALARREQGERDELPAPP